MESEPPGGQQGGSVFTVSSGPSIGPGLGVLVKPGECAHERARREGRCREQLVCLSPQVMMPFAILLAAVPTAPVAYVVSFVSGVSIAVSLLLPW